MSMNEYEMMGRCQKARGDSHPHGRRCRVYSRYVMDCSDCSFGSIRYDCGGNRLRKPPNEEVSG